MARVVRLPPRPWRAVPGVAAPTRTVSRAGRTFSSLPVRVKFGRLGPKRDLAGSYSGCDVWVRPGFQRAWLGALSYTVGPAPPPRCHRSMRRGPLPRCPRPRSRRPMLWAARWHARLSRRRDKETSSARDKRDGDLDARGGAGLDAARRCTSGPGHLLPTPYNMACGASSDGPSGSRRGTFTGVEYPGADLAPWLSLESHHRWAQH